MNTIRRPFIGVSFMHEEGGWPKDISLNEPEMMIRHRKKLEKEENYQICMPMMYDVSKWILVLNLTSQLYISRILSSSCHIFRITVIENIILSFSNSFCTRLENGQVFEAKQCH
jgi:hypothetical protein